MSTASEKHEPVGVVAAAEFGEPPECSCGKLTWCGLRAPETIPVKDRSKESPLDAEGRVRLYLELYPYPSLAADFVYDDRFRSEEWPRRMYALNRADVLEVLADLDRYEEAIGESNEARVADARQIDELKNKLQGQKDLVASMRLNGARHWFAYGYQKCTNVPLSHWTDFCKVCDKEKDHPAHFSADAKYLDSREVEEAAVKALTRVYLLLQEQGMGQETAKNVARELLAGIPGVPE